MSIAPSSSTFYTKTVFPIGNPQDVAMQQDTLGAANLHLNGFLAQNNIVSFINYGYARQVSFVSHGTSLTGITFTIYGIQNGVAIVEPVTGPGIGLTTYSSNSYDTITAITTNGATTGVSVGTGPSGFFNLIDVDGSSGVSNYTLSLGALYGTNQISTTVYSTLDDINNNGSTFSSIISGNIGTLFQVKAVGATNLYIYPVSPITTVPLVNQILVQLTGTPTTNVNSTTLIYRQTKTASL